MGSNEHMRGDKAARFKYFLHQELQASHLLAQPHFSNALAPSDTGLHFSGPLHRVLGCVLCASVRFQKKAPCGVTKPSTVSGLPRHTVAAYFRPLPLLHKAVQSATSDGTGSMVWGRVLQ